MSADYRPRGGRRRRGGRGRGGYQGDHRGRNNGNSASSSKKSGNPISRFFSWLFGKKSSKHEPKKFGQKPYETSRRDSFSQGDKAQQAQQRPRREPTDFPPQEITTTKLYVGNLSYDAAESDLFDLFSKVGAVKNVEIAMDRHSSRSKGFGFVEMEELATAKEAAAKLNRTEFLGRQIVVNGAKLEKRVSDSRDASSAL